MDYVSYIMNLYEVEVNLKRQKFVKNTFGILSTSRGDLFSY